MSVGDSESIEPGRADLGASGSARRLPSWVYAIGGLALMVILAGVILVSTSSTDDPTYDEATQQRFLDACSADGGDPVRPACQCIYDQIVATIPYDQFVEIDKQLVAANTAGEPFVLPSEVQALVPACQVPA